MGEQNVIRAVASLITPQVQGQSFFDGFNPPPDQQCPTAGRWDEDRWVSLAKSESYAADGATSNVVPADNLTLAFQEAGALLPPYEPTTLTVLLEHSNCLRQRIDAMVQNVHGFGHRIEPVLDLDANAEKVDERIAASIYMQRHHLALEQRLLGNEAAALLLEDWPTEGEVRHRKDVMRSEMRQEKSQLDTLFDNISDDHGLTALRRRSGTDQEVIGQAFWEVLRDGVGKVHRLVYVPSFTMRLCQLDPALTVVARRVKVSDFDYAVAEQKARFRRYVQIVNWQRVYFKEFGDPRAVGAKTGRVYESMDALRAGEPQAVAATELLSFVIPSTRTAYGIPRWIGALLEVLGSRQAAEVNYLYFENKSVPPLVVLVAGGRLSQDSTEKIRDHIESEIKGKRNFHNVLVLEGVPSADAPGTGRMSIDIKPLTAAIHDDALFQNYDQQCSLKVGQAFRLPPIVCGDSRDYNRATSEAALAQAEQQVFQPAREEFDDVINRKLFPDLGVRYHKFVSQSPIARSPQETTDMATRFVSAGVLTPNEGRDLAADVFNREYPKIEQDWATQPIQLTAAGLLPEPEAGPAQEHAPPPNRDASGAPPETAPGEVAGPSAPPALERPAPPGDRNASLPGEVPGESAESNVPMGLAVGGPGPLELEPAVAVAKHLCELRDLMLRGAEASVEVVYADEVKGSPPA